jgi:hypothetical protein
VNGPDRRHRIGAALVGALLVDAFLLVGCMRSPQPIARARTAEELDFDRRCSAPEVVRCIGFDDHASIEGGRAGISGLTNGATRAILDSEIKASGASSLKFSIPPFSGSDTSGAFFTNFSDDLEVQFGENQEFFVQWRQRFSSELLATHYDGGGGWKLAIVGTGDQPGKRFYSCTALTVVVQSYYQAGFPILYNSCTGSASHGPYDGFYERTGTSTGADFKLQNGRASPYCLYSQERTSYFPPSGNCFAFAANEWMTFQLRIKIGPRVGNEFIGSYVSLWAAHENATSELLIDWGPYNLTAGDPAERQQFGKVWLLPYHTGKSPLQAHPVAYTWYDELIISRGRIPDPAILASARGPAPSNNVADRNSAGPGIRSVTQPR